MTRRNYDTVTETMAGLKKCGYTIDFSILTDEECLICHLTSTVLSADDFEIDDFYRFEGGSDPGDEMIVYAISSKKNNLKGIVMNAYGIYADHESSAIVDKLNAHPTHNYMDIIENITSHFQNKKSKGASSPEGTCPVCWGQQQYDGKIRTMLKDKQIDIKNHKDSYMLIQDFMVNHIDGIKLKDGIVSDCPRCSMELDERSV